MMSQTRLTKLSTIFMKPIHGLKRLKPSLMKLLHVLKRSKIARVVMSLVLCLSMTVNFIFPVTAFAAPAALIPVAGELVKDLLLALGVVVAKEAVDGGIQYVLSESAPYVHDIFSSVGAGIEDWVSVVAKDVYYTDGAGTFYIGADGTIKAESLAQLVIKGNSVATSYVWPTNLAFSTLGTSAGSGYSYRFVSDLTYLWDSYSPSLGYFYIPYLIDHTGAMMIGNTYYSISSTGSYTAGRIDDPSWSFGSTFTYTQSGQHLLFGTMRPGSFSPCILTKYTLNSSGLSVHTVSTLNSSANLTSYYYPSATTWTFTTDDWASMVRGGVLITEGAPRTTLLVDKEKLEDKLLIPVDPNTPPPDDDDEDPVPFIPPSLWDIFDTVTDLIEGNNNGTTLGDFINNNYNYNPVNVDINVPERFNITMSADLNIDANVSLGGDITINVNVDDKTELPSISEGDGENFFSADALDVFAGLTKNNPVMSTVTALFGVIDPALVAVFSVTISLGFLLALWRLIRGG